MIKVMIVDDDPTVAEFNKCYVDLVAGFQVKFVVHSAVEAFRILDTEDIDLILLDIFMPGMTGLELLINLRRVGTGVDVMIITAACDRNNIKKALQFGAVDYIIKPFEFERLNAALVAYQDLFNLMDDQEDQVSQIELDQRMLYKEQPISVQLPKGIDRQTLRITWEKIKDMDENSFSTEKMAKNVGISRISMRKYLEFLRQIGMLELELIYGTIGRPVYKYRYVKSMQNSIQKYL